MVEKLKDVLLFVFILLITFGIIIGIPLCFWGCARHYSLHTVKIEFRDGTIKEIESRNSYVNGHNLCIQDDVDLKIIKQYDTLSFPLSTIKKWNRIYKQ